MKKEEAVKVLRQYLKKYEIDMVMNAFDCLIADEGNFEISYHKKGVDHEKTIKINLIEETVYEDIDQIYIDVDIVVKHDAGDRYVVYHIKVGLCEDGYDIDIRKDYE